MRLDAAEAQLALELGVTVKLGTPDAKIRSALGFAKVQVGKYDRWRHLIVSNYEITVVQDYDTGTAAITKGLRTVKISGGIPPSGSAGRFFSHSKGSRAYEIKSVSGLNLTLKTPIAEASASGLTYSIRKVYYRLPTDLRLTLPDTTTWDKRSTVEVSGYDEYAEDVTTGVITLTKGSKTATFTGATLLDAAFPGDEIEIESKRYRVRSVMSDTEIKMVHRAVGNYSGKFTIKSDTPYKGKIIGYSQRSEDFTVGFDYVRSLYPMVADDDDTELPVEFDRAILDWATGEYKRMPPGSVGWENNVNIAQRHLQKLAQDSTLSVSSADLFPPAIPPGLGRGES